MSLLWKISIGLLIPMLVLATIGFFAHFRFISSGEYVGLKIGDSKNEVLDSLEKNSLFTWVEFQQLGGKLYSRSNRGELRVPETSRTLYIVEERFLKSWLKAKLGSVEVENVRTNNQTWADILMNAGRSTLIVEQIEILLADNVNLYAILGGQGSQMYDVERRSKNAPSRENSDLWVTKPASGNKVFTMYFLDDRLIGLSKRNYFVELP